MREQVFTNARVVTDDADFIGTVVARDGRIAEVTHNGTAVKAAKDLDGDLLIPGLVELHTDNLETHMTPRPKAEWPATAAIVAHDTQITGAGITTVFDSIALGAVIQSSTRTERLSEMIDALDAGIANGLLQADHTLHLRCEVSYEGLPEMFDALVESPRVHLVSVMDHTPGQRQFVAEDTYRNYYKSKFSMSDDEIDAFISSRKRDKELYSAKNRQYVVERARDRGISLASHDDATEAHVNEAVEDGMSIAEFPTTVEAAAASHRHGLSVLMGAPNLVRGGSHSGNVSARDLAELGVLDIISSDYAPHSMLHAAFLLYDQIPGYDLPSAIRTVTKTPARSAGLDDRGEIAIGKRADLVRVKPTPHHPLIRGVWREGVRIS